MSRGCIPARRGAGTSGRSCSPLPLPLPRCGAHTRSGNQKGQAPSQPREGTHVPVKMLWVVSGSRGSFMLSRQEKPRSMDSQGDVSLSGWRLLALLLLHGSVGIARAWGLTPLTLIAFFRLKGARTRRNKAGSSIAVSARYSETSERAGVDVELQISTSTPTRSGARGLFAMGSPAANEKEIQIDKAIGNDDLKFF